MNTTETCARLTIALFLTAVYSTAGAQDFVTFESEQVRPLALAADGQHLYAVNTPDNRLEIFAIGPGGLTHQASVPVGMEPVAVAARGDDEVWVVNHLSDSISIVDVGAQPPLVARTLLVGDEPRDIVFAGPARSRAFITTAHRGQNSPVDPALTTAGVGRADVWVFDANDPGDALGGTPLTIVTLFSDVPRALAVTPGGQTVYAAAFHSGNQTTTIPREVICLGGADAPPCVTYPGEQVSPGGLPAPNETFDGAPAIHTALIVKYDGTNWVDELGRPWGQKIRFFLPDKDVFAIDATADPPAQIVGPQSFYAGVGTTLFNMIVNPVSGKVYVTNTEAFNHVRFEGPREPGSDVSTVRGHLAEARITILDGATVTPRHLNKHIDYDVVPSPPGTSQRSLATPTGMAITRDGQTLYVAAFGSSKVGVFDTSELEDDSFQPDASDHILLSGGGPSGLVLAESRKRLYVLTRFNNAIAEVDTETRSQIASYPVYNPEPAAVVAGRVFLYDGNLTSSNGEASCSSCHVFGNLDDLAWDLGDPGGAFVRNPGPFIRPPPGPVLFHPMKGPMTTQSLRGLANNGPMHWRGDRTGGNDEPSEPPNEGSFDEDAAFKAFNGAFVGLIGREETLSAGQMQAFTTFALRIHYPPNPHRALDNSLNTDQATGRDIYFTHLSDRGRFPCQFCHKLDPELKAFGTDGRSVAQQNLKIPHLRNLYTKVGMFGMPAIRNMFPGDNEFMGDQIRGFGYTHDGSRDTLFRFHSALQSTFPPGDVGDTMRRQIDEFLFVYPSNLAPIVGQQVTLTDSNAVEVQARIELLVERAGVGPPVPECDLIVKGNIADEQRGFLRLDSGLFRSDRAGDPEVTLEELLQVAQTPGQTLTFTCTPPGSGTRMGIDRDRDGVLDGDEA